MRSIYLRLNVPVTRYPIVKKVENWERLEIKDFKNISTGKYDVHNGYGIGASGVMKVVVGKEIQTYGIKRYLSVGYQNGISVEMRFQRIIELRMFAGIDKNLDRTDAGIKLASQSANL